MSTALVEDVRVEALIKAQAYGLGFDLVGIATLGSVETAGFFDDWIASGYAGQMDYLERGSVKRRDSRLPVPGALSAIVVGLGYGGRSPSGPIARYARGDDYHDVMTDRLNELHGWLQCELGRPIGGKAYVDTGPILERDLARRAGLGWFGKNTNLVSPRMGSFFFIGSLLIDVELEPDAPFEADRCGSCTRCLDACPTGAFVEPRVLDATRCISYLTIENKGPIPEELREQIGSLIYGCDICQDVCPWNVRFASESTEPCFEPRPALRDRDAATLATEILQMDDETFRNQFSGSPMKRAKRRGLARNAAVVLGNTGSHGNASALSHALEDPDPLVREHAEWAVGRIGFGSVGSVAPENLERQTRSAESVVDVYHADPRTAGGEHGVERDHPALRHAGADGGRYAYYGSAKQPGDDCRQSAVHSRHHDAHQCAMEFRQD
jgi:epoxyqueuosine reductase